MVIPFDTLAAVHAAHIWWKNSEGNPSITQVLKAGNFTRAKIKADIQIIATALARKAGRITTHDDGLVKSATGHIEVGPMQDWPARPELGRTPTRS